MTQILVPSFQLGLTCGDDLCCCAFGSYEDGIIGNQYVSSLSSAGIGISPSVHDFLSTDNFGNSQDSVEEVLESASAEMLASCPVNFPVFMHPAPELLDLMNPTVLDAVSRQKMLGGVDGVAFRRAFEAMRRMQRWSGNQNVSPTLAQDASMLRRSVVSDIVRSCDLVTHQFGKTAVVVPAGCPSFVDEDGVAGWRSFADGRAGSSNAASRAALTASLSSAAALSGLGSLASDGSSEARVSSAQYPSQTKAFCFHMSSGYPLGCSAAVDGTSLPNDQTYRQPLTSSISANFSHQALSSSARLIFREAGVTTASFCKRLMSPPMHLAVSGVSGGSSMSASWYGMLPVPGSLIDDMVRPIVSGMLDSGVQIQSIVIAEDMERLLQIATSSSHPKRYGVRRCIEHQFLHRKLKLDAQVRTRVEGSATGMSSLSWNLQDAHPQLGTCLPDEMWCDLGDSNGHDWKSLINTCGSSDSNWQAYRYSRPGLPSANPFAGMRIRPNDFNTSQSVAIANLPSFGAREVVDLIRWEFFEWTRQVGIHLVNLVAAKGRYSASGNDSWKILTHGQVEV